MPSKRLCSRALSFFKLVCLWITIAGCDASGPGMQENEGEVSSGDIAPQRTASALSSIQNKLKGLRQDTTIGPQRNLREELQSAVQAVREVEMVKDVRLPDDRLTATVVLKNGITLCT